MNDLTADQLELPSDDGAGARVWTLRTAGGHRVRVAFVPARGARVATIAAVFASSPTNGQLVEASLFAWPMRVGHPIAVADSRSAEDYWSLNAVLIAGETRHQLAIVEIGLRSINVPRRRSRSPVTQ